MLGVSQLGQDIFCLDVLGRKHNGTFVDIGAAEPDFGSNTYRLEHFYGWWGLGIDNTNIRDADKAHLSYRSLTEGYQKLRPLTDFIIDDATKIDYEEWFFQNRMPTNIDFLSIDLEPPEVTLEALYRVPFYKYTFSVVVFETDDYRGGDTKRKSREFFRSYGYDLVGEFSQQDDFYIHSSVKSAKPLGGGLPYGLGWETRIDRTQYEK